MLKIRVIYCGTNLTLPHLYYCFFFPMKIKRFIPVVITTIIITIVTTIISTIEDLPQWRGSSVPRAPLSLAREHKCSPDHDQNDHHANDYYDGDG